MPLQSTKQTLRPSTPGQVGEAEQGDGLAGAGGADHGHGLAPQLGRAGRRSGPGASCARSPSRAIPEGRGGQLVVAGPGDQPGGLAVAGALVDALAAADEGAPLGPAGGPLGVPHRQRGGQQPDRDGQPHLGGHQVPEELADGDAGAGWAEAEVEGDVLPEVLGHEDVPAQGLLGAGHGEHDARCQARLARVKRHQCQRRWSKITAWPEQPGHDGQRGEPDQQQHDQQQAVGGRLAGGPGDRLAGGGLPAAGRVPGSVGAVHEAPPVSAGRWCPGTSGSGWTWMGWRGRMRWSWPVR